MGCDVEGHLLSRPSLSSEMDASVAAPSPTGMGPDASTEPPPPRLSFTPETSVSVAMNHSCALLERKLWCWGALIGSTSPVQLAPEIDFVGHTAGSRFHCALDDQGTVYCLGDNEWGKLGTRDEQPRGALTPVDLPGPVARVEAGEGSTCALLESGSLWCWGRGEESELGVAGLPGFGSLEPLEVETDVPWSDVELGWGHTCALKQPGTLWCWGRDTQGQVGIDGPPEQYLEPTQVGSFDDWHFIHATMANTCGIRGVGQLYCWGTLQDVPMPEPEPVLPAATIAQASTNTFHRCAHSTTGELWCWGRGIEGQLGTGDIDPRDAPTRISTPAAVKDVAVGRFHSCIILDDASVWCTGENVDGQLGVGDIERRRDFTRLQFPAP